MFERSAGELLRHEPLDGSERRFGAALPVPEPAHVPAGRRTDEHAGSLATGRDRAPAGRPVAVAPAVIRARPRRVWLLETPGDDRNALTTRNRSARPELGACDPAPARPA